MINFTQPILQPLDSVNWVLYEAYRIETPKLTFTIPKGFKTDLASVPRCIWNIYPPFGLYTGAAVAHDYIYRTPQIRITREEADLVFLELMQQAQCNNSEAKLMYSAVRAFGHGSFKQRRE
ncbi:DUF1353 domain-containing protein [Aeromonas hydrophila]|uniref:DUF1353 domain-containing protein n=1 Tax=Aeromonas hydrophila TaxID=644 RepID=A0AAX3PA06_AERHY|nr:DUF1353 domain-containing protein [Aeromonas hydrophila]WEE28337.1 DUF1353 domain-containing protein [Aeromonas hydrophila]